MHTCMTPTLIGDRFVVRGAGPALDLATGARVRLGIEPAGTRAEQQAWTDACTRAHAEGTLVDFGFIGERDRFEARPQRGESSSSVRGRRTTAVVEWLDEARPSSSRVLHVAELPDIRAVRQRGFVPCDCCAPGRSRLLRRCARRYFRDVLWRCSIREVPRCARHSHCSAWRGVAFEISALLPCAARSRAPMSWRRQRVRATYGRTVTIAGRTSGQVDRRSRAIEAARPALPLRSGHCAKRLPHSIAAAMRAVPAPPSSHSDGFCWPAGALPEAKSMFARRTSDSSASGLLENRSRPCVSRPCPNRSSST
jgi:hypothetical protein